MLQTNRKSNWRDLSLFRRWRDLSLRAKIILTLIIINVISINVLAYFAFTRASQIVAFLSGKFENSVQVHTEAELTNTVNTEAARADQLFLSTRDSLIKLADYRAQLENQAALLGQGAYWDARTKLIPFPEGQYGNSPSDIASVTLPSTAILDDNVVSELNISAFLDFSAPEVLNTQPQVVAVYYIGALGTTTYYPNINLISLVPADFDARTQPFYTIADPQNNPERLPRWTQPYQDPAGTGLIVTASAPVYNADGTFKGVMGIDMQLARIAENISSIKVGETGFAFLVDSAGRILVMPPEGYAIFGLQPEVVPVNESPKETILGHGSEDLQAVTALLASGESGLSTVLINGEENYIVYTPLDTPGYRLGVIVPVSEFNAGIVASRQEIQKETSSTLIAVAFILLGLMIGAIVLTIGLGQVITAPLARLTHTAEAIAGGDINAQAQVESRDEIGALAGAFNRMTQQLREFIGTLESRVKDRTRGLELAADVGRSISQVRDLDVMLRDAAEIIRARFNLYYTQVYLIDLAKDALLLRAGTGTVGQELVGRGHKLPLNINSINGRAAIEKRSVVIADTEASETFQPNPSLPDTRSEMAVPLMVGETVVGVLDMQSSNAGALNEETLPAFEALAGQLAIAIQNANLLAEAEQARAEVEVQARRLVRTNWKEYLDAVHKPEQIGFAFENNQIIPMENVADAKPLSESNTLSAPIAVTGESLGSLIVEMDAQTGNARNQELINIVARQVAQQIENLRLLDSAERYRFEAEEASRRLTRESWKEYAEANPDQGSSYIYDLKEVRPYNQATDQQAEASASVLPLKIHDETVGKLVVQGLGADDSEALSLANAVAERLAEHIESLRQFDQTQSALAQSEKLFEASALLTQAVDLQELTASTVKTLDIPKINRAVLATFNYDAEGNIESLDVIANWWNGTGHEVTPIGTHYPLEIISAMPMFISPTPVFFNDTSTDPRSDAKTMELVNKLNLRAVAVLPLFIGTSQMGSLILEAEEPHNFRTEETRLFTALAPQIATVLENRRQFVRAQQQAEREGLLNTISQKIQSATTVEAVLQIAARELGRALGAPMTIAQLGMKDRGEA